MLRNTWLGVALIPLLGAACAVAPEASSQQASALSRADEATDTPSSAAAPAPVAADAPAAGEATAPDSVADAECETPGRYVVSGGTATDQAAGDTQGLVWQLSVDPALRSQADAEAYCGALMVDGAGGFRLPSSHELQSLLLKPGGIKGGPGFCMPSIDQAAFPSTPSDGFWSVTVRAVTSEQDNVEGYETGFDDGRTHPAAPTSTFYVRCVK